MSTGRLSVSAICQHFEKSSYLTTGDTSKTTPTHVTPSKFQSESVTQKKQPPKTRPKSKTSDAVVAQSGETVKSAGDTARPGNSFGACDTAHHELEPSRVADDECTNNVVLSESTGASNTSHIMPDACEDAETTSLRLSKQRSANILPSDDRTQTTRVERDDVDIIRRSALNHCVSTSSPLSGVDAPSTDDVKEAINRAKQKRVLWRIAEMKLEDEILPQPKYEADADHCDVTSHSDVAGDMKHSHACEPQAEPGTPTSQSLPAADDTTPFAVSTDDVSSKTDHAATSGAVKSQHDPLSDNLVQNAVVERDSSSPVPKMPSTDETSVKNEEESGSTETQSATAGSSRPTRGLNRRPVSMYPQDIEEPAASADTVQSTLSVIGGHTNDSWTSETLQPDDQASIPRLRNGQQQSPLTENTVTVTVTPTKLPPVARSRNSYMALTAFVGDNFSFLNDFDDSAETRHVLDTRPNDSGDACVAMLSTPADSTTDQTVRADSAENSIQDRCDEKELTDVTLRNDRPKSMLRKSIVLPNGKILEIIGNAFTFLDGYDEQIADNYSC